MPGSQRWFVLYTKGQAKCQNHLQIWNESLLFKMWHALNANQLPMVLGCHHLHLESVVEPWSYCHMVYSTFWTSSAGLLFTHSLLQALSVSCVCTHSGVLLAAYVVVAGLYCHVVVPGFYLLKKKSCLRTWKKIVEFETDIFRIMFHLQHFYFW